MEEVHSDVKLVEVEAAASKCDVRAHILTAATKTEDTREGHFGGFIDKVNAGAVSTFEVLLMSRIAQTACD